VLLAFLGPYLTIVAQVGAADSHETTISPFGFNISTEAFFSYSLTLSVILQLISYIMVGSLADFGNYRKMMLVITSVGGSISVMLFIFLTPGKNYWLGGKRGKIPKTHIFSLASNH
jgi:UMF1 family MFS transporter